MLRKADPWILATREKPEPFEPVIGTAFIAGRECTIQALLEWNGTQWWVRDEQYAYDHEVFRWMYLPEPPKHDRDYGRRTGLFRPELVFLGALLTLVYIVGVAITHRPAGWLTLILR